MNSSKTPLLSTPALVEAVRRKLADNKHVLQTLHPHGRIHIDRQLPFLFVYRTQGATNPEGTERLVTSEASYLITSGDRAHQVELRSLVQGIVETLSAEFGAFLLVELWASGKANGNMQPNKGAAQPSFGIITPLKNAPSETVEALRKGITGLRIDRQTPSVDIRQQHRIAPTGMLQLINTTTLRELNCFLIGLEIDPIYVNPTTGELYPLLFNRLRRNLGRVLRKASYEFSRKRTTRYPAHYQALGKRSVTNTVWDIDTRLAAISNSFDFLLQVTPINPEEAWKEFRRGKFRASPTFRYRPVPLDPELIKRGLFNIPIERVEDPTLAQLFLEKQAELDRQVTMLRDRGTKKFLYASIQLYGHLGSDLIRLAELLLDKFPKSNRRESRAKMLSARQFAEQALAECNHYREINPEFPNIVEIRKDVNQGLMVSSGRLLIGDGTTIPQSRADALLQHEVGTHVLTYCNGKSQQLKQLYSGLAGYDEFQEGTAVLAEYLVGGLSRARMRVLAARVIAVRSLIQESSFADTYALLHEQYGFTQRAAFTITMRVYRGGGLTKDAIYLRGLVATLDYLRSGGEIEPLFVGKIAAHHVPIIRELQLRNVLRPAPLLPRYLAYPEAIRRLQEIRKGLSVLDLVP